MESEPKIFIFGFVLGLSNIPFNNSLIKTSGALFCLELFAKIANINAD